MFINRNGILKTRYINTRQKLSIKTLGKIRKYSFKTPKSLIMRYKRSIFVRSVNSLPGNKSNGTRTTRKCDNLLEKVKIKLSIVVSCMLVRLPPPLIYCHQYDIKNFPRFLQYNFETLLYYVVVAGRRQMYGCTTCTTNFRPTCRDALHRAKS